MATNRWNITSPTCGSIKPAACTLYPPDPKHCFCCHFCVSYVLQLAELSPPECDLNLFLAIIMPTSSASLHASSDSEQSPICHRRTCRHITHVFSRRFRTQNAASAVVFVPPMCYSWVNLSASWLVEFFPFLFFLKEGEGRASMRIERSREIKIPGTKIGPERILIGRNP